MSIAFDRLKKLSGGTTDNNFDDSVSASGDFSPSPNFIDELGKISAGSGNESNNAWSDDLEPNGDGFGSIRLMTEFLPWTGVTGSTSTDLGNNPNRWVHRLWHKS